MPSCEKCGAKLEEKSVYCPNCGERVKESKQTEKIKSKKELESNVILVLGIFVILILLTSLIFNVIFLVNNDWHLQKRLWWNYQPYVATQSFFDEKLAQSRQEGHDAGYSEGYTAGEKAGYDKGYSTGRSEGYNQGLNAGAQECQEYISTNQKDICTSSQQDLGSSLLPILLQAFLSAIF